MFNPKTNWSRGMLGLIARYVFLIVMLGGLSSCANMSSKPAKPKAPPPEKGTVSLKISAQCTCPVDSIPKQAYVFPPLKINEQGIPLKKHFYTEAPDGSLIWHSPEPKSAEIQREIEKKLQEMGYQIVTFNQFSNAKEEYSILSFNPYYSAVLSVERADERQVDSAYILFTRLTGSTFPKELSPEKKRELIIQDAFVRFNSSDDFFSVIKTSFNQAIKHIGKDEKWVETGPLWVPSE